jgi:MFS family permease
MHPRFAIIAGIFPVMALSNAIVPVLASYAADSTLQGAIFAAYFFGAFVTTLPAGLLSDRYGRLPVIRVGLILSVISGCLLFFVTTPGLVVLLRALEGAGAGLFVAAAMAYVNSQPDHARMSGQFIAMLNVGLVTGLLLSGWLAVHTTAPVTGILVFTILIAVATCASFFTRVPKHTSPSQQTPVFFPLLGNYRWLWYSTIILVGITGVVTSLYPKFSGVAPDIIGIWISGMNIATIVTVLVISRMPFSPVTVIRWAAVLLFGCVMISFFSPLGFVLMGALAGVVMIAQMAFLAEVHDHQGIAMGLFTTASYLGMTVLPFVMGVVADGAGFFTAFFCTAILAGTVALTIGWCSCNRLTPAA